MGAVVSCITGMFRAIGAGLMAVVNGIGAILTGIIHAIVAFFDVIISCLTCGRGGVSLYRYNTLYGEIAEEVGEADARCEFASLLPDA
ncbi:hypothetical protein SBOR_8138 [Sclerotinia borealis F-4128]|uniref:Uncharacterized protein n=1 Tax=Sclerotinia borealis (strain F-4128) TaxID=1432307 RepID=W9C400_SCLBF|nr:hypothetical protein SBOR_8138 [Sclerotinia borealis F-4128]